MPLSRLKSEAALQQQMEAVFRFVGLPPLPVADVSHKNKRHYPSMQEAMPADVRRRLTAFYAPHNRELYSFCDEDLGWPSAGRSK